MDVAELPEKERAARDVSGRPDPIYFRLLGASANGLYVTTDDALLVVVQSSVPVTEGRVRYELVIESAYRTIGSQPFAHPGDGSSALVRVPLTEGFLDSVVVGLVDAAIPYGAVHAAAYLQRAGAGIVDATADLFSRYVSSANPAGWPHPGSSPGPEGAGRLLSMALADPAAGADYAVAVPTGRRWEPQAFQALLTTAVAVANRRPQLHIHTPAGHALTVTATDVQTASLVVAWAMFNQYWQGAIVAGQGHIPLPIGFGMAAGWELRTETQAIQAADQWSAGVLTVREWLDP